MTKGKQQEEEGSGEIGKGTAMSKYLCYLS